MVVVSAAALVGMLVVELVVAFIYGIVGSERSYDRTLDFGSLLANTLKTSHLTIWTTRSDLVGILCFFQKHYRY